MKQTTIAKPVEMVGIGLHKGHPVTLRLEPLEANRGIEFFRKDVGVVIALTPQSVVDTQMATVIGKNGHVISTIEHLLSSIYAYGIDNIRITLDSDEVPVMDGSSASFCMLLDEAGQKKLESNKRIMRIKKAIEIRDGDKYVKLYPSTNSVFDFTILFDHPAIKRQSYHVELTKSNYKKEIAKARTFGFTSQIQYLQSKNLAMGASLDNAIGLDDTKVLNSEGLRYPDEFVRHKILDAIGDMSLLGMNFIGSYEAFAGSHALNHALTKALLADADAYEVIELSSAVDVEYQKAYA
ncbi:MAG: UDP-3-O-(3-hydroxymyristoyl) glucosamine N-acyltransferase [Sulfurovum sp. PC08-66]|nr:MAG: UDP-3-O-(3-hydroxymyristoyl) glucosamine N-acyltransferase [Sulfurovum sp. PC08-66]KIM12406.1 MAG: UDP-3-O-(3-hydroxymyristoyl) glucosamine N-acyltransferase [Sulfuricurvum sp. PC08-66]